MFRLAPLGRLSLLGAARARSGYPHGWLASTTTSATAIDADAIRQTNIAHATSNPARSFHSHGLLRSLSPDLLLSVSMNVHSARLANSQFELVDQLRSNGVIKTDRVEEIMKQVDRKYFARLPESAPITKDQKAPSPYAHEPTPIGQCSTISSPYSHAIALEAITPYITPNAVVLDVGSGSGYLTACLGHAVSGGLVVGLEHSPVLIAQSKSNIKADKKSAHMIEETPTGPTIIFVEGDGNDSSNVWLSAAGPAIHFDLIHAGVAFPTLPRHLLRLLKVGGHMLLPLGIASRQQLVLIQKLSSSEEEGVGYTIKTVMACSYANIAKAPPSADVDSIHPILRDRDAIEEKLKALKLQYTQWENKYAELHHLGTRRPTMAEMRADPIALDIFNQVAPLRKKKEAYERIIERYEKSINNQ